MPDESEEDICVNVIPDSHWSTDFEISKAIVRRVLLLKSIFFKKRRKIQPHNTRM